MRTSWMRLPYSRSRSSHLNFTTTIPTSHHAITKLYPSRQHGSGVSRSHDAPAGALCHAVAAQPYDVGFRWQMHIDPDFAMQKGWVEVRTAQLAAAVSLDDLARGALR